MAYIYNDEKQRNVVVPKRENYYNKLHHIASSQYCLYHYLLRVFSAFKEIHCDDIIVR